MNPKIAMLIASTATQSALRAWALRQGFDLTTTHGGREITDDMFDFHVTLLATTNPISAPLADNQIAPIEVEAVGFEALGVDADTPVLTLDASEGLEIARAFFVEVYGAEPTFADFKPHISLSYNWIGEPALDELDLPAFPLVFDRLVVKDFEIEQKSRIFRRARPVGAHALYR